MGRSRRQSYFPGVFMLGDALAVTLSVLASFSLRYSVLTAIPITGEVPDFAGYLQALVFILPAYILCLRFFGLYKAARHVRRIEEIFRVIKAATFAIVVLMAMTFFYREFSYSRVYLLVLWILSAFFLTLNRYALIQWEYQRKRSKKDSTRVLILGASRHARSIIQWAAHNPHYGHEVVAVLARDAALVGKHVQGFKIEGELSHAEAWIEKVQPDQVVLIDTRMDRERLTDLVELCEDRFIDFKVAADFYGLLTKNVQVEYLSGVPLLGFKELPLDDVWNRVLKRSFDALVSLAMLAVSLPLWAVIIAVIKFTDRGPVFYRQQRMGRDQKVFDVLKFRTMRPNAERETGPVWAHAGDARRTRTGEFLRRWNLDELPQLLNVLKGDMSLVGPRPERPHFIQQFRKTIPRYMARHKIKSGLTGWAQVNGLRGNTSIHERLKYDLYYMENWSLFLDIEILAMTFTSRGFKNAY